MRLATPKDIPAAQAVIAASARGLQRGDYTKRQIESALGTVYGVDSRLIADGTYFVAEVVTVGRPQIVGCGGWSKRRTLFGGDAWRERSDDVLDPAVDAAKIRAFFVHPDWARRGVGTLLLEACEDAARASGFTCFEAGATLTGAKFFAARHYAPAERMSVPLEDGISIAVIHMVKDAKRRER